ncbi:MAG: metallophosphoesterase family protein, partial [Solirubrobacteraceae bacterium]
VGDGQLRVLAGEPLRPRTELGPAAGDAGVLLTLAHVTDAHVLDASSPARVTFLGRLGPPFQSTFRPQETLTAQVLAGAARAVRALSPTVVVQGGDLIDNVQHNELVHALGVLHGGWVSPGSGRRGYYGVQLASDTDPFYYRPAVDAPRHPRLLRDAVAPLHSPGMGAPVLPVFGDHDALVSGTVAPTVRTRALAVGDRALWNLPTGLTLPADLRAENGTSPDGPPNPGALGALLDQALQGPTVRVPPDPARRQLDVTAAIGALRTAAPGAVARTADRLDYVVDVGTRVRLVVLDLVRRDGGSGGAVDPAQPSWLARTLAEAAARWVIVISHQPLAGSVGAAPMLAELARAPHVVALLAGHIHRNAIVPRPTPAGGYWEITTASLIDYPQQARAIELRATSDGGVAIHTWMLDHVADGALGTISRELSYLDAQGGRPEGFAGAPSDRNAILYRRAPVADRRLRPRSPSSPR